VIQLDNHSFNARFTRDDLKLLMGVAGQASIAVSNARLHREVLAHHQRERDLFVARGVQRALLPSVPGIPGYAFQALYEPAYEVGGDYYDFLPLPGGRLAVLLGDVAGKGVAAALIMVKFSVEARICLQSEPDLAAAVTRLNAVLLRADLGERYVTLAAAVLDPVKHTITLVNAGHPSPQLVRSATGVVEDAIPLAVVGPPLGLFEKQIYFAYEVPLEPGDGLMLFSDGVTEATNAQGRQFLMHRVRTVLQSARFAVPESGERLLRAVREHATGCDQSDDTTLVSLGRAGS
jgi:phosphoserine phosphatase RsbU/P